MRKMTAKRYETSSRNTEERLAEVLRQMMEEKPLSKISIRELTERCGMNRKTFYYHFEDIYALLRWTMEHEAQKEFENVEQCKNAEELMLFFIRYADQNRRMTRATFDGMDEGILRRQLYDGFHRVVRLRIEQVEREEELRVPEGYREFVLDFYADALGSCLMRYIQQRQPATQEEMMAYTKRLLQCAVPASLREETKKVIP